MAWMRTLAEIKKIVKMNKSDLFELKKKQWNKNIIEDFNRTVDQLIEKDRFL